MKWPKIMSSLKMHKKSTKNEGVLLFRMIEYYQIMSLLQRVLHLLALPDRLLHRTHVSGLLTLVQ